MATFSEYISSETPVLVDFYADWCGPCKTMAPILEDVKQMVSDQAKIIKINIDKNPHAAEKYNVRSVPTLILFRNGKILWRQSGVVPASTLHQVIRQHTGTVN